MKDWWQETFPNGRQTITIEDAQGNPVNLAYGTKGTGQPLVLVHGLGMWSVTWRYNIDALSKHCRVICVDAKGYGFSDKPSYNDEPGYKAIELARILKQVCDEPAIVVTQSLWGTVSLAVAEKHPELISALVVLGAAIFPKELPTRGLKIMEKLPMGFVRTIDRLRITKYIAPLVRLFLRQQRSKTVVRGRIPDEDIYWKAYPYIEFSNTITRLIVDVKLCGQEIKKCNNNSPCVLSKIRENLPNIKFPTLVLWGEKDQWFAPEDAKDLVEQIPNAELKIIPNCGHDSSSDCNDEINQSIIQFLKKVEVAKV